MVEWPSSRYKPQPGTIPKAPGVYRFLDPAGRAVYVGKAKILANRLSSYFRDPKGLHPRTQVMLETASSVEWTVTSSETEALVLEQNWIQTLKPRFNVAMKEGGSRYPSIVVTVGEQVPRFFPAKGDVPGKVRRFGPYPATGSRELMEALTRAFQVRSCSPMVYKEAHRRDRPCLLADIGKCTAPCVGRISVEDHRKEVDRMVRFLSGASAETLEKLQAEMEEAAASFDFEKAARRRDEIQALGATLARQTAVTDSKLSVDSVACRYKDGRAACALVQVRGGVIRTVRTWEVEPDPILNSSEQLSQLLGKVYPDGSAFDILVEEEMEDASALGAALSTDKPIKIRVPRSGARLEVIAAAARNAQAALESGLNRLKRGSQEREEALSELSEILELGPIWRLECIDIAHTQGTNAVGSVVTIEGSSIVASDRRRVNITAASAGDDLASVREVVTKRFTGKHLGLTHTPDLLVIDGALEQAKVAKEVLDSLGMVVPVIGLAKRLEEVWVPGDDMPVILPRASQALLLLQAVRDEAHRTANRGHAVKREKAMVASKIETVKGLGPAKRRALLAALGTPEAIRSASVADLSAVEGIGPELAKRIKETLG